MVSRFDPFTNNIFNSLKGGAEVTEKGLVAAKNAAELLGTQLDHLVEAITTRATKIPGTHLKLSIVEK